MDQMGWQTEGIVSACRSVWKGDLHYEYSSLEASYLAEGTRREITNTMEPANCWERSPIVHSDPAIKEYSAKEGPQIGVEHEGRDDIDSQDAAMTEEEIRTYPTV